MVQGTISKLDLEISKRRKQSLEIGEDEIDPYEIPKQRGIYVEVPSEREIETQHIIQRIIDNRLRHLHKYSRTSLKEQNYYSQKEYIEEL